MNNRLFCLTSVRLTLFGCLLAAVSPTVEANVTLPAIFGDHMVLQQEGKIPVWGEADPGEKVTVTVGSSHAETQTGPDGHWRIDLPACPVCATAVAMTVSGKNTLKFEDVLIGDVWLASGQSNMELALSAALNAKEAIPQATNSQIRLFLVTRRAGITPKTDLQGTWMVCSPESAASFSAVAYFFGQDLQQSLQRPIGLIGSYWGGTSIQSWTSIEALKAVPLTANGAGNVQKRKDAFPKDPATQASLMAEYRSQLNDWLTKVDVPYQIVVKKWRADVATAKTAGQPEPPRPQESPSHPNSPDGESWEFTTLFNGMINPLIPFGIKGVIWYQGESNSNGGGKGYDILLQTLIADWRARWNEGDLPFLIVQLANFDARLPYPTDSGAARVREAQSKTVEKIPNTGLAVTIDLGLGDIHPPDKLDVGKRLAAAAKHVAYGQNVPYAGPLFERFSIEGNNVRLKFKNVGTGLVVGTPPRISNVPQPPPPTQLVGFAIAGADQKWTWADASIDGSDVIVSSAQVSAPVAARYGWASNIQANLSNQEGFPAVPFRTDEWPYVVTPPSK